MGRRLLILWPINYGRACRRPFYVRFWTWLSWRGKSKLPNEPPIGTLCEAKGCASASSTSNSMFPGLGFESQSRQLFCMWLQWQLILINQSIDQSIRLFKKHSPLIDRGRKLEEGKKPKKWFLTGIRTPDLETWNWNCHSTLNCSTHSTRSQTTLWRTNRESALWLPIALQCSNGCALGSLLFPRQQIHGQS